MSNMYACIACIVVRCVVHASKGQLEGKTLGEMWAAVIKAINILLRRSVASSVGAPNWGQSRSKYMPRRGPCRTCSRGAERRLKPKYVQWSIYLCSCKETFNLPFHRTWLLENQHPNYTLFNIYMRLSPTVIVHF
jgi:hypothetical protein